MNTNQSQRKQEFRRKSDEERFSIWIGKLKSARSESVDAIHSKIIERFMRPNSEAATLDYTDNTQFFGEDY